MSLFDINGDDQRPARFAARLPILTRDEKVFGYKLLFRSSLNNCFPQVEGETASRGVIDMSSLIGLTTLSNSLPAFIVTTREILVGDFLALLPPDKVIAEIPDSVAMDDEVLHACKKLKESGRGIALSNFRTNDPRQELEMLCVAPLRSGLPVAAFMRWRASPRAASIPRSGQTAELDGGCSPAFDMRWIHGQVIVNPIWSVTATLHHQVVACGAASSRSLPDRDDVGDVTLNKYLKPDPCADGKKALDRDLQAGAGNPHLDTGAL